MKVVKRQQVTEVVTTRQVSHTLQLGNNTYTRHETIKIVMPYMDCNINTGISIIKWCIMVKENVSRDLSKKEVKEFMLEEYFSKIALNEKNGNA